MLKHVKTTCRFPKLTDYPKSSMKPLQAHVVQKKLGTDQFPFDHRSKPLEGGKAAMAFNATWLSWTSSGASSQRSRHAWRVGCPRLSQVVAGKMGTRIWTPQVPHGASKAAGLFRAFRAKKRSRKSTWQRVPRQAMPCPAVSNPPGTGTPRNRRSPNWRTKVSVSFWWAISSHRLLPVRDGCHVTWGWKRPPKGGPLLCWV